MLKGGGLCFIGPGCGFGGTPASLKTPLRLQKGPYLWFTGLVKKHSKMEASCAIYTCNLIPYLLMGLAVIYLCAGEPFYAWGLSFNELRELTIFYQILFDSPSCVSFGLGALQNAILCSIVCGVLHYYINLRGVFFVRVRGWGKTCLLKS